MPNQKPAPGNTYEIGFLGLGILAIGLFGPLIAGHYYPHMSQPVKEAIDQYSKWLMAVGGGLAYVGMPFLVKK